MEYFVLTYRDCNSPHVLKIVPTFDDAIACVNHLDSQGEVDSVWIMGGSRIYQVCDILNQCPFFPS